MYSYTTDYHWPTFNLNGTVVGEGDWTESTGSGFGPFGFGYSVIYEQNTCMMHDNYGKANPNNPNELKCVKNPRDCVDGLSFSIWEKIDFDENIMVDYKKSGEMPRRYVMSTGAQYDREVAVAWPGFAIYHQGVDLVAVVSTGEEVYEVRVTGQIFNATWNNIGIRFKQPNLTDHATPIEKLGGLELYVNLERVGHVLLPEFTEAGTTQFRNISDAQINKADPPVIMIGCHWDHQLDSGEGDFMGYSNAEFDEIALWTRQLVVNKTHDETVYFFGGKGAGLENVNTDLVKTLLKTVNLANEEEQVMANELLSKWLLDPVTFPPEIPTRTSPKDGNTLEGGASDTQTTTPMPADGSADGADPVKDETEDARLILALQALMTSMMNVDDVRGIHSPRSVENRFPIAVVAAKIIEGLRENVAKWQAVYKQHKNEEGVPKTMRQLQIYMLAWVKTANTSSETRTPFFDPETNSMNGVMSGEDFAQYADKVPPEIYKEKIRMQYPNYAGLEWKPLTLSWNNPKDSWSVPTGMYKDQEACRDKPVAIVSTIYNQLSAVYPRRRNPALIRGNDWRIDARIIVVSVAGCVDPSDFDDADLDAADLCHPNVEYMKDNPVKYTLWHKEPGPARIASRHLTSTWFSDSDYTGIEVRHCVWWNEGFGPLGAWDANGCKLITTNADMTECECQNFGAYTVVAEMTQPIENGDDCLILMIIKYVGIGFSICLLLLMVMVTILSKYVWDMFHVVRIHIAICWMFAISLHVVSDLDSIRSNPTANLLVGFIMMYFYTASAMWTVCESHATFKAFTGGIISGRTKIYFPFGYGTPVIPLGVLFLVYHDDLGIDPRCFVGWNDYAKIVYLSYNGAVCLVAVVFALIILFNMAKPQTKRRNVVADLTSQARGLVAVCFLKSIFWAIAAFVYLHNEEGDMADPYCYFCVLLGWFGVILFLLLGLGSKKFRYGLKSEKKLKEELMSDIIVSNQADLVDIEEDSGSVQNTILEDDFDTVSQVSKQPTLHDDPESGLSAENSDEEAAEEEEDNNEDDAPAEDAPEESEAPTDETPEDDAPKDEDPTDEVPSEEAIP